MRRIFALAALGLGLPAGAQAACNIDEAGIAERYRALAADRGTLAAPALASLGAMRQTAEALDRHGHGAACDAVVDAALRLIETDDAWVAQDAAGAPSVAALNLVSFAESDGPIESAGLVGRPVHGPDGALLGTVDGLVLDQWRDASHLIVAHGAVWGGAARIAVPSPRMLLDPSTGRLYAELSPERLVEAPAYDRTSWDLQANDAWYEAEAARLIAEAGAEVEKARSAAALASDTAMATGPEEEPEPEGDEAESTPRLKQAPVASNGPKRIRVERDRPERAQGSND